MFINKYLLKVPSYVDIQILHIGLCKEQVHDTEECRETRWFVQ